VLLRNIYRILSARQVAFAGVLVAGAMTLAAADASAAPPPLRGLAAVRAGLANTGTYGAPLIDGCQWATWVAQCHNLTVYGNGPSFADSGCGTPNGCTFGSEFQCTELAQRYAYYAWGEPQTWDGYGGSQGNAYEMWNTGPQLPVPLAQFANNGGTPPQQGDLMIFSQGWLGSYWDSTGHVAIVEDVSSTYVDIIQQNGTSTGSDRFSLSGSTVTAPGYTPVIGWLRNTGNGAPAGLPAGLIGGAPQAASAQAGTMDVFWRGNDNSLWTMSYRNGAWAAAPTPLVRNIASDPALVSTPGGRLDAFWKGTDGNIWRDEYTPAGWGGARSLGDGPIDSAPHAIVLSDGSLQLFWRGRDGNLWTDTGNTTWTGARFLGDGPLGSDPYPVSIGSGHAEVFWHGHDGNIWYDTNAASLWSGAQYLAVGQAGSDPRVISSAPGIVDVFWVGMDSRLWHAFFVGRWYGPEPMSAAGQMSPPTTLSSAPGLINAYLHPALGNIATLTYRPSVGWVGPAALGDGPIGSDPAAVVWNATGGTELFWRGLDGGLWYAAG
jgi:CHAP domain